MVTVSRRILISAPKEAVQRYLRDLANMREYDRKFERVDITYPDAESGVVEASGRFLGLPWRGAFRCQFTRDGGYRKELVQGSMPRMVGSLHLRPVTGGTVLTQEEQYHLPSFVRPLVFLVRSIITRSMERELGAIKEGAERLYRQDQLRRIESL